MQLSFGLLSSNTIYADAPKEPVQYIQNVKIQIDHINKHHKIISIKHVTSKKKPSKQGKLVQIMPCIIKITLSMTLIGFIAFAYAGVHDKK